MPRFDADFTTVDAGFPVHSTGRYQVKVTKVTPFMKESRPDSEGNTRLTYGVNYPLVLVGRFDEDADDETLLTDGYAGKQVTQVTVYTHTPGGWQFAKPFLIAVCGYNVRRQENEANEKLFQANEWHIDGEEGDPPENIEYGNGFDLPVDRLVNVTLIKKEEVYLGETREVQELKGWTPVGGPE